eukprot:m.256960 g.256960  ORF g.256960 m.256960 type:complete len:133 (-) comp34876_c0_seq1:303-701(-)
MTTVAEAFALYGGKEKSIPATKIGEALRVCGATPTEAVVREIVGNASSVNESEFQVMLGKCPKAIDAALVVDLFSVFDKNGAGTISFNELKAQLGEVISTGQVTEAELKAVTKGCVAKGQLNYADFTQKLVE